MSVTWDDVKQVLGKIAPVISNAVLPGSGGIAASLVSKVLGVEAAPDPILSALQGASPEQIRAIKEVENKHEERLLEIAAEIEKAALLDRQDARLREREISKATGNRDLNLYALAWTVVVGFFTLVGFLVFYKLPQENVGPVNQLFGAMQAGFLVVLGYFFGTSASSNLKTKIMARLKNDKN